MNTSQPLFREEKARLAQVECLGLTFESDEARRQHFLSLLRAKLADPAFRKIDGFPVGSDEDILGLSDPPYFTACPNPFIPDFIKYYGKPYDPSAIYGEVPLAVDVSEGKNDPIYNTHSYHTKVPHKAIMRYVEHYTRVGDVVLDGYCGTGMTGVATALVGLGRSSILVDLSPIATFIARNLNGAIDSIGFLTAAKAIIANISSIASDTYATNHTGWKVRDRKVVQHKAYRHPGAAKGEIDFVLYSDVVSCSNCGTQHPFYSIAVNESEDSLNSHLRCPTCGVVNKESDWGTFYETRIDPLLEKPHKDAKTVPVLINYSVGKSRFEKIPDEDDLNAIGKIEDQLGQLGFPIVELIRGKETQRNSSRGITHLHHFFNPRELYTVALLLQNIKRATNASIRHALLFALTACLPYASKMRRFRADRKGGGPLSGTLYVGSLTTPPNVMKSFLRNAETIASSLAYQRVTPRRSIISTQSSTSLDGLPNNSIDYIFVDPPFGSNFDYSELNFFWEGLLGVVTNQKTEAIVSSSQEKAIDEYRVLLTQSFQEFFRTLKPGRWMTVEFSNTQASVWNTIQTALQEAGFVVANVSALDKKQGSFKAVMTTTAVKQDLVISAYKPNGGLEERFVTAEGNEDSAWDFVRTHLKYLPTVKLKENEIEFVAERDPRVIFDRMVAFFVRHSYAVPVSSQEFQAGLSQRFADRDGMVFLPEQVTEYDRKRMQTASAPQMELFISDERSAIDWLTDFLRRKPSTYQELHPEFIKQLGAGWKKHEAKPELSALLEDNFLRYDPKARDGLDVPSQIHSYLSSNWATLRNLDKNDPRLRVAATDRWFVPDANKAQELEKVREKALLKEFETYKAHTGRKLKEFRLEVMRTGFKTSWGNRDYATIIAVAKKVPDEVLQEDEKLLLWYDQALTRMEDA